MSIHFQKIHYMTTALVSSFAGVLIYSVLSYLYVEPRITIPISIVMSTMIFGLTKYYSTPDIDSKDVQKTDFTPRNNQQNNSPMSYCEKDSSNVSLIVFVIIYIIAIIVCSFSYQQNFHIFTNWDEISLTEMIELASSIILCFFLPGFAIIQIITRTNKLDPILKVLLAYLLSILTTGLTGYIAALSFDKAISESKYLFISVYLGVLVAFLIYYSRYRNNYSTRPGDMKFIRLQSLKIKSNEFFKSLRIRSAEILVFGSLLALLVLATYYLFGGITIGDQWYHQGRALLFMSGIFKEAIQSGAESFYPPFQSTLLAALTTLSGIPLVNSYASIAFLNITPVFGFYYFFSTWVPPNLKKARLLACALFTISAGFGWIYLLNNVSSNPIVSAQSSLDALTKMQVLDIVRTSNFVIPTAPDFSTGLIYIALPAGFILLGMVRTVIPSKFANNFIISAIAILGIISHYEFYIFIIISSLLPIIFVMKAKNYVYVGLIFALLIVILMDLIIPGKFFTSIEILGFPLLYLTAALVAITWAIYLTGRYFYNILSAKLIFLKKLKKLPHHDVRIDFLLGAIVTSLVAYIYLLSFITLSEQSINTTIEQTRDSVIPWYLYPMRLGMVGLFALAFILSYIFKKFEKHVFVFGIIIVISLLLGPYYDENRFSKYTMIGATGFASLILFKIITSRLINNPHLKVALMGAVVVPSCLSILIFIGYNSLILQTHDFVDTLSRRHFPSMSELQLFELLHDKVDVESQRYNVVSFLKEYDGDEDGIMGKIQGFSGLPYGKLQPGSSTLNSSTLDTLFRLLSYNDVLYIVIPKDSINGTGRLMEPTLFVMENFKRVFEDSNYILIEVPSLLPPMSSSNTDTALIYNQMDKLPPQNISDAQLLHYDNKTFDLKSNQTSVTKQTSDSIGGLNLLGANKDGITVWSKSIPPENTVNYIEAEFQITNESKNNSNDVRLEWQGEDRTSYYVKFSHDGLELYQKLKSQDKKILSKNTEADKRQGVWYTLKVENLDDSIKVYLNDLLQIQTPKGMNNYTGGILKVGLTSHYNNAQFKPLKIGNVSNSPEEIYNKSKYYDYYYPLSLLALSRSKYNIFNSSDLSAFSKNIIITPDAMRLDNSTYSRYLDYVNKGGTLIVINSNQNFNQTFSRLFSMRSVDSNPEMFKSISSNNNHNISINVPGLVKKFEMERSPDINVTASYRDSQNQSIAPFAIERPFSNGGRIVFLNAEGFFNTILKSPNQYFFSLTNMSTLLGLDSGKLANQYRSPTLDAFLGKIKISGKVTLNSSSLSPIFEEGHTYPIRVSGITIYDKANDSRISFDNISIKNLKLMGDYEASINLIGPLELPDMMSDRDYISMRIPTDFNMTVNLLPKRVSQMEIIIQNESSIKSIKVKNDSKIEFYKIEAAKPMISLPLSLRNPSIKVNGNISIENAFPGTPSLMGPIHLQGALHGMLQAKFGFVDNYEQPFRNVTKTQYVTYLESLKMDRIFDKDEENLKLPGDIYFKAKESGQDIQLKKIFTSSTNLITLVILISISVATSSIIWRKKHVKI